MPFRGKFARKSKEGEPNFQEENGKRTRVVIYGNRIGDHVDEVASFVIKWCSEHGLGDQITPVMCRHEEAIEMAFYGLENESDTPTIPAVVMAGQNIRIPYGVYHIDKSIERDMRGITELCKKHNVPLVRFTYDANLQKPLIGPRSEI